MLMKKLKKIEKECRKADDPILLTLSTYVSHVVNFLELAEDDEANVTEYGNALAQVDLSAVVKAHETLAVTKPKVEQELDTVPEPISEVEDKKAARKAKNKDAKKAKNAKETQATDAEPTSQEADESVEPPVEGPSGEEVKKTRKNKKKGK